MPRWPIKKYLHLLKTGECLVLDNRMPNKDTVAIKKVIIRGDEDDDNVDSVG